MKARHTSKPWYVSGSSLIPQSTGYNVGIGMTGPRTKLEVRGLISGGSNDTAINGGYYSTLDLSHSTNNTRDAAEFRFNNSGQSFIHQVASVFGTDDHFVQATLSNGATSDLVFEAYRGNNLVFSTYGPAGSGDIEFSPLRSQAMVIKSNGNVGIGTTSPDGTVHIQTNDASVGAPVTDADDFIIENSANGGVSILTADSSTSYIRFGNPSDTSGAALQWDYDGDTNGLFRIGTSKTSAELSFATSNFVDALRIDSSGNVGIGTTGPNSLLQVDGSFAVKRTAKAANYTTVDEVIIGVTDTTAARTITLASTDAVEGRIVIVKDESGAAGTNNITVATEGVETIDGGATTSIIANYGVVRLYSDGSNWFIM